jgi:hypothetical protein
LSAIRRFQFAPQVFAGANWKRLMADKAAWLVLGSAGAFAALSMISHVGLLRWMFRLLPYFHVSIVVLAAMALTRADEDGETWSFDRLALVIAAEVWLAFGQARELALTYLAVAYAFGVLAWISTRFGARRDIRWTAMAVATTTAMFGLTLWQASIGGWPQYPRPWRLPTVASVSSGSSATRFQFVHPPSANSDPGPTFWATHPLGNATLYAAGRSFGGYSPMPTPLFAGLTCWGRLIDRCDDVIPDATAKVDPTGRSLLDLAGVNEVDIQRQSDAAAFAAVVGATWREDQGPGGDWRFTRNQPVGLVTWTSPGAQAATRSYDLTRIVLAARNDAPTNGALVIARAWYPSWRATLDGSPVRTHPLDDALVVVDLPPKSHGLLTLTFWPKGLTAGLVLAALGALLMAAAALFPALVNRPASWMEALISRQPRPNRVQPASVDIS